MSVELKELTGIVNEYRAAMDAANAAKALLLEAMEAYGIKKVEAVYRNTAGRLLVTTASYREEGPNTVIFDKEAFCSDKARAALYDEFRTKPRKGNAATVSFKFETVKEA